MAKIKTKVKNVGSYVESYAAAKLIDPNTRSLDVPGRHFGYKEMAYFPSLMPLLHPARYTFGSHSDILKLVRVVSYDFSDNIEVHELA